MAKLYALCTAITLGSTCFGQVLPRYHATHLPNSRFTAGISASGAIGVSGPHPTYGYYVYEPNGSFQRVPEGFSMVTAVGSDGRTFLRQDLGGDTLRPWLWDRNGGLVQYLNPVGDRAAEVTSCNLTGQSVGYSGQGIAYHAVRWNSPTSPQFLRTPSGNIATWATAIDEDGFVVGDANWDGDGMIWSPGSTSGTFLTSEGERLKAWNLLGNGWVLATKRTHSPGGRTYVLSRTGALLFSIGWTSSTIPVLHQGNRHGILGGTMGAPPLLNNNARAAIWSATSGVQDLTALTDGLASAVLSDVRAIADNGIVYAWDNRDSNNPQLYMLTPVPEPGSLVTLGLGIVCALKRRGSKRKSRCP